MLIYLTGGKVRGVRDKYVKLEESSGAGGEATAVPAPAPTPDTKRPVGRPQSINAAGAGLRTLPVQMPVELHSAFKDYCAARELVMGAVVREYVVKLVENADNTPAQVRREKFEEWLDKYKGLEGAKLERMLEMFRQTEEEVSNSNGKK